ncbi:MAG: NAD(+) kinase [Gammaproteobacteria bacterium]|nr:NAD(+) kinase [Gammaproteobacteria bacterium]
MPQLFHTVGIIGKHGAPIPGDTLARLSQFLLNRGHRVLLEQATADKLEVQVLESVTLDTLGKQCDLGIVVGGDGTLLHSARTLADNGVPLLGINLGRLGFLADISPDNMLDTLSRILSGQFEEEQRHLLQVSMNDHRSTALNDVVIHKWNTARMIEFETYVDDSFVGAQHSDGLIVSTPTGSTAYALSGGGPLMPPDLDATLLVPICPHTLSNRPIVISGNSVIEIRVCDHTELEHVRVTCDGQSLLPLSAQSMFIRKHAHPARLIHPEGHDHFNILRAKLGWGGHPKR